MSVLRCVAVLAVALLCSSGALAQQSFTFTTVSTLQGNGLWGAVDQYLRPLNRPEAYVSAFNTTGDSSSTWGVAPAGSFLLWGTQPDISLSPDQGTTWWYVAGTTAGSGNGTDRRTVNPNFPGVPNVAVGNTGCSHRASFNRFYLIGNNNGGSNQTQTLNSFTGGLVNVWFAWASNDGSIWNQVMSNATAFAMASSRNTNGGSVTQDHVCVVDSLDNAYDIGSSDTWKSVNLGVGWAAVASTSYFPARWGLSAAIYSPTATSDVMVVLGGTNNVTGALLNDVWTSSTGGQSWSMLATAPWPPRQEPNFAINSNGVMVVYGGDCGGGWCGVSGDAWVSVNGGSQWYQLSSTLSNFTLTALAFDNAGYLWLVGGQEGITGNDYDWTSAVQKSSLSFSTSAISQWSQTYTGGQTFTVNAQTLAALQNGPAPQGGNQSNTNSSIAYVSAFSCAATTLPNTGAAFNMTFLNNGNGWGSVDIGMMQIPAPIVYGVAWSGTNATYDPYSGYWQGTAWAVAPVGSWVMWGTQQDVAISTNAGLSWTLTAGGGGTGLGYAQNDYHYGGLSTQLLFAGNAECGHRNTFSRFYVIGNNGANNASVPFEVWASDDAQIWEQVADSATQTAMAVSPNTSYVGCVVSATDVVIYLAPTVAWQSTSLGRSFSQVSASTYFSARQSFSTAIYAPSTQYEVVVVLGGQSPTGSQGVLNDVWTTTNYGTSWSQAASSPGFAPRLGANLAVAANGVIVMHGGQNNAGTWFSDVWVSAGSTPGAQWAQLAASTGVARAYSGVAFDVNGYLTINSGQGLSWSWNADVWKSTYSFNNIAQWAPTLVPSLTLASNLQCTQGTLPTTFDMQSSVGSTPWGTINSYVRVTQAPITYVTGNINGANQWAVAPAGSWFMYGTQPDVSLSTNAGATWTITSGANSSNPYLDSRDLTVYPTGTGNAACSHRTTFNRFYLMGSCNSYVCTGPYFNWATEDGQIWYQVMDAASSTAMQARTSMTGPICVVDQQERSYLIGGADTWSSSNMGVSWSKVTASAYFTARTNFAGGVYSPTAATDTFVVIGGSAAQDVWQTTNYGQSWSQVASSLPWSPRTNVNFAIASNGVFVLQGGDQNNGNTAEYGDAWMSLNYGQTWTLLSTGGTTASSAPGVSYAAVAFDQAGYFYLLGGQVFQYTWTSAQYKSTLSFFNVSVWAPLLSGNGATAFTPTLPTPPTGAPELGGLKSGSSVTSPTVPTGSYSCAAISSLPTFSASVPFDILINNTGIGWGTVGNAMGTNVQPVVYEVPYTNSSTSSLYTGNQWAVAPVGSLFVWGGNSDVAISTNNGISWVGVAGLGGNPGLPQTSQIDYTAGTQGLGAWNTQCQHRGTFNRFYVIGNNQLSTSATVVPFAAWASDDSLTWFPVMDNATSYAMASDKTSDGTSYLSDGVCLVGINDNVYYVSGARTWVSTNLGVTFSGVVQPSGSSFMNYAATGTRFNHAGVIYTTAANTDRIVVLGGQTTTQYWMNDVWASTNYGSSWQLVSSAAPWSVRQDAMVAVSQSGVMVLVGGMEYVGGANGTWVWNSDAWASMDGGSTWLLLRANTTLGPVAYGAISVDSNGYVVTSGGMIPGWSWADPNVGRSTYSLNNIQQWYQGVGTAYCSVVVPSSLCAVAAYSNPSSCTTPNVNSGGGGGSSLSGGAIAGIVIGSVVGAAVLLLLVVFFCCSAATGRTSTKSSKYNEQNNEQSVRRDEESHNNQAAVEMGETS